MENSKKKRMDVLDHLYPYSETPEEQERVKNLFLSRDASAQALEEWKLVEKLHLVPTMKILWEMSKKCDAAGINLYLGTDCRQSALMRIAEIPYVSPEKETTMSFDKFYRILFEQGPILMCDAETIFDLQKLFIDCFDERHIYMEGYSRSDTSGQRKRVVHPAHFLIVPVNKEIENICKTELCADYCLTIYKGEYPSADNLPCLSKDYEEISDSVWRCRLFALITER